MAAFRKLFLASAVVTALSAFATTAFATTPFTCAVGAAPTQTRLGGQTEEVGDIILTCTGGTPTPKGSPVPVDTFTVELSANITSRALGIKTPPSNGPYPYLEPVLAINDPQPNVPAGDAVNPPGAPVNPASPYQVACPISDSGDSVVANKCLNTGDGIGGTVSYGDPGNYNIFQAYTQDNLASTAGVHTVVFDGIPVDAPGSGTISFRITNIRVATTQAVNVTALVIVTGSQPPVVNGGSVPVLVAQPANPLVVSAAGNGYAICEIFYDSSLTVTVQEGIAAALRRRTWYATDAFTSPSGAIGPGGITPAPVYVSGRQNVFGYPYFTESGFYDPLLAYEAPQAVGLGTQGTRIYVTLSNIPDGIIITPPQTVDLFGGQVAPAALGGADTASGILTLVKTDAVGAGYFASLANTPVGPAPAGAFKVSAATPSSITAEGSTYVFVYETMFSDPGAIETATFNFGLTWVVGAVNYSLPTPQYIQAQAQLAPWSGNQNPQVPTPAPSADTSIPRFVNNPGAPINTSYLTGCQCDLLFPYVVDDPGALATGLAIANTTSDPYISTTVVSPSPTAGVIPRGHSATPTSGYVSLYFYPNFTTAKNYPSFTLGANVVTTKVGTPILQTTLLPIPSGDQLLLTVGQGAYNPGIVAGDHDGVYPLPGFAGYLIAVTGFKYCHGYAFISDPAVEKLAEGYVGLVLDAPLLYRPYVIGEALAQ